MQYSRTTLSESALNIIKKTQDMQVFKM